MNALATRKKRTYIKIDELVDKLKDDVLASMAIDIFDLAISGDAPTGLMALYYAIQASLEGRKWLFEVIYPDGPCEETRLRVTPSMQTALPF